MIKHIVVDILDKDRNVEQSVRKILSEKCNLAFNDDQLELRAYTCNNGVAYVYRVAEVLLLDILGAEDLFDELLKTLPRQYLMIRLLERGIPIELE